MMNEAEPSSALREGSEREFRFLARELDRLMNELLAAAGHGRVDASEGTRLEQLERYIGGISSAQRLRLAGALHLLSPRLDGSLAAADPR